MNQTIRFEKICKSFGEKKVLDQVSFSVPMGEVTALMAASGTGKTTLLRILMGLETADSGQIHGMEDVRLSAVFQENRLCENLSPVSNIRLVTGNSISRKEICQKLDAVGILSCASQPVRELSGGQCRRVALLRALLAPWDLLLLDEPFQGLDKDMRRQVMDYILLCRRQKEGRAVLLVTHEKDEADYMASRVITL